MPDADARSLREVDAGETADEVAASRYLFDRTLQPVGQLEGFTRLDNIQLAALRYQLNYLGWGLALTPMVVENLKVGLSAWLHPIPAA